ncbi:hypothetical protein GXB81_24525 [Paraburkholderia sp. Ac-20336]|uniref:hypothetical protein n=1 Tax=Burkholderiaceae TaxID=119060 RepID=UPI00141E22E4|nr:MULTISPECIES: hypothetical protein [Burkholderiaceae]MBN3806196.1 hypothetical protein [Paraburkholderia sp. Ac-20336]
MAPPVMRPEREADVDAVVRVTGKPFADFPATLTDAADPPARRHASSFEFAGEA